MGNSRQGNNYRHGHGAQGKQTKTYRTWKNMRGRCNANSGPGSTQYKAKGIRVCKEWDDFTVFLRDMGEQPEGTTIDRIDNSLGYSKENCRWATVVEQARNKTTNLRVTIDGKTKVFKEWCEIFKIDYKLAHGRLMAGSTVIDALTKPRREWGPYRKKSSASTPQQAP